MLTEKTGKSSEQLLVDNSISVGDLNKKLQELYESIKGLTYKIAVDQKISSEDMLITQTAEIALLPPFAGG